MDLQDAMAAYARLDPWGCLIWHGPITSTGYPVLYEDNTQTLVHRAVFTARTGETPEVVHHTCEMKLCVLFEHLEAKTIADHMIGHKNRKGKFAKFCMKGHRMMGANLYVAPNGWHQCKTCKAENDQLRRVKARRSRPKGLHTHCHKGHELTFDNLYFMGKNRLCKRCFQARAK